MQDARAALDDLMSPAGLLLLQGFGVVLTLAAIHVSDDVGLPGSLAGVLWRALGAW